MNSLTEVLVLMVLSEDCRFSQILVNQSDGDRTEYLHCPQHESLTVCHVLTT